MIRNLQSADPIREARVVVALEGLRRHTRVQNIPVGRAQDTDPTTVLVGVLGHDLPEPNRRPASLGSGRLDLHLDLLLPRARVNPTRREAVLGRVATP